MSRRGSRFYICLLSLLVLLFSDEPVYVDILPRNLDGETCGGVVCYALLPLIKMANYFQLKHACRMVLSLVVIEITNHVYL